MARTSRVNRENLYAEITGRGEKNDDLAPSTLSEAEKVVVPLQGEAPALEKKKPASSTDPAYTYKTHRITEKQYRAIMIKKATSTDVIYPDQSSVVRAALDAFLADIIETL